MDLTYAIIPKSDQLNADDLITGPRTFTVAGVREGSSEQPVNIDLVEFPGRPFRPSKTVLRILITAWGKESTAFIGRRMTLYRKAEVRFGGQEVGGIRVSELSHIDKPIKLALTETRGKKDTHHIKPLADAPAPAQAKPPTAAGLLEAAQNAVSDDELNRIARTAVAALSKADLDAVKAVVTARRAELKEPADEPQLPGADL